MRHALEHMKTNESNTAVPLSCASSCAAADGTLVFHQASALVSDVYCWHAMTPEVSFGLQTHMTCTKAHKYGLKHLAAVSSLKAGHTAQRNEHAYQPVACCICGDC